MREESGRDRGKEGKWGRRDERVKGMIRKKRKTIERRSEGEVKKREMERERDGTREREREIRGQL